VKALFVSVLGDAMLKIGDFSRLSQVPIKTLRFYDQMGLFSPAQIDPFTGYRYYTLDQLSQLNRILALKDLEFSLEQIARLLDDDLREDELHGMLRLKQMELQQQVEEAQARLIRLQTRLKQIEMEGKMPDYEMVLKKIEPQRVLSIRQIVPSTRDIRRLFDEITEALHKHHIQSNGPWIAMYHHPGFRDIDLDVEVAIPVAAMLDHLVLPDGRQMTTRTIPAIARAMTVLLHGNYNKLSEVYMALNNHLYTHRYNYLGPAREVYLRGPYDTDDPAGYLTEIQYPIGDFKEDEKIDGIELPSDWADSDRVGTTYLPFSRRARTALEFAKVESVALRQVEVRPVHMLMGLLRDSEGLAGHVLAGLGLTIEQLRLSSSYGYNQAIASHITDATRQVVSYANEEAKQLGHDYIGTEHLLLGLVRQRDETLIQLLTTDGVSVEQVRTAVLQTLNR
jgi:DNA-binding transcriptional MerR regulator